MPGSSGLPTHMSVAFGSAMMMTAPGLPADLWSDIMEIAHAGMPPEPLLGAEAGIEMSEAAEERVTFYRGMAQAFGTASSSRSGTSNGVRIIRQ